MQALLEIVAKETRRDPARLSPDATLASLGLSSLDMLSLVFSLEDRFAIALEPEDLEEVTTLGQLIALVERHAAEGGPTASAAQRGS